MKFVCETRRIKEAGKGNTYLLRDENGALIEVDINELELLKKRGHSIAGEKHNLNRVDALQVAIKVREYLEKTVCEYFENTTVEMYQASDTFVIRVKDKHDIVIFSVEITSYGSKIKFHAICLARAEGKIPWGYVERDLCFKNTEDGMNMMPEYINIYLENIANTVRGENYKN